MSRIPRPRLPRYIRVYVEGVLCCYEENRRQLRAYREEMIPSAVPQYGGAGGGGGSESRPAEALGIRLADDRYIREKERVVSAVERVLKRLDRHDRRLVTLVYLKRTNTVSGAALTVNMGKTMAYENLNAILWAVAEELGLAGSGQVVRSDKKCGKNAR